MVSHGKAITVQGDTLYEDRHLLHDQRDEQQEAHVERLAAVMCPNLRL